MEPIEIETTCPDAAVAEAIARVAVAARLAACAWVMAPVASVYRWGGAVEASTEVPLRLKSRADLFEAVAALIRARHPYATPAILAWPVRADAATAEWIAMETGASAGDAPG